MKDVGIDEAKIVRINGIEIELRVGEALALATLRLFAGSTPLDSEVDALTVPFGPLWLVLCIGALRWYRRVISPRLGRRCVFDPSCSRYSELAFRRRGFFKGMVITLRRLQRCRPGAGGTDVL
jgi:putative membrane protein insertion efficiency factor